MPKKRIKSILMEEMAEEELRELYERHGHGDVFQYYETYTEEQKQHFLGQLRQINVEDVN